MVQWQSLAEVTKDSDVFTKLIFSLFGLYVWEIFETSDFEWSLLTRKRRFTWPLSKLFFFLCRYCMLFALVGLIISLSVTTPINCTALYTFNSWTGNMAILTASTSLMIRTIALWQRDRRVIAFLSFLCLCHWAILWRGMFIVHATYSSEAEACVVTSTDHVFLNVGFFTTIAFDFAVLCFTLVALFKSMSRSDLWKLLFQDGLVYFCVTFLGNALPAIFNVLDLNTIMNVIATIPAATIASVAACRLVMRLHGYTSKDAYVHSSKQIVSTNIARGQIHYNGSYPASCAPEIMVTTDQIVMKDFSPTSIDSSKRSSKLNMDLEAMEGYSDIEVEGPEELPKHAL